MPRKRRRRPKSGDPNYPYIYKQYGDKTVKSRFPVFTQPWSAKQHGVRNRLREASRYAVAVATDPAAVAFYTAAIKRKKMQRKWTVRNVAMSDFFNPPEITKMNLSARAGEPGATLRIGAYDKFGISAVTVSVRRGKSVLMAEAAAISDAPWWRHTFAAPLPAGTDWEVVVAATDRPGNRTTRVLPATEVAWKK